MSRRYYIEPCPVCRDVKDVDGVDLTEAVPVSELSMFENSCAKVTEVNSVPNRASEDSLNGVSEDSMWEIEKYHSGAHVVRLTSGNRGKANRERVWPSAEPTDVYEMIISNQNDR